MMRNAVVYWILAAMMGAALSAHAQDDARSIPAGRTTEGRAQLNLDPSMAQLTALLDRVPMFNVNLNNYKYHGNPILTPGPEGSWDERMIGRVVVFREAPDRWLMWFSGADRAGRTSIGLATSKDGIHWDKYPENPVLEPTEEWEGQRLAPSSVVRANGKYYLYYWVPGHVQPTPMKNIVVALSEDGIHWTGKAIALDGEPGILNEGSEMGGSGVDAAKVFYIRETGQWRMIFTGFGPHGTWNGLAASDDGLRFTKLKAPLYSSDGFQHELDDNFLREGETLRCPVRINSVWCALDFVTKAGECSPAVSLNLEDWITAGPRILYGNQDYEGTSNPAPVSIEASDDRYFIYYMLFGAGGGRVCLIEAPRRSTSQPMLLWENEEIGAAGAQSMIIEPTGPTTFHLKSDAAGSAFLLTENPIDKTWSPIEDFRVGAGDTGLCFCNQPEARLRLQFKPVEGAAHVSAWAAGP